MYNTIIKAIQLHGLTAWESRIFKGIIWIQDKSGKYLPSASLIISHGGRMELSVGHREFILNMSDPEAIQKIADLTKKHRE